MRRRIRRRCAVQFTVTVMPVKLQFHSVSSWNMQCNISSWCAFALAVARIVKKCIFLHLHHSEFEVSIVLEYGATSLSDWCYITEWLVLTFWPLEMRPPCCIGTSSTNHAVMWCHIPEDRASQQHRKVCNWLETSQSPHATNFTLVPVKLNHWTYTIQYVLMKYGISVGYSHFS